MVKRTRTTLQPTALNQLVNGMGIGVRDIAEYVGVTTDTISKALREDLVSQPIEIAARHMLSQKTRETNGRVTMIVVCNSKDAGAVEALVRGIEGKCVNLAKLAC